MSSAVVSPVAGVAEATPLNVVENREEFLVDLNSLKNQIGGFAFDKLAQADLLIIANKLIGNEPLTAGELQYLVCDVDIIYLGKLSELVRKSSKEDVRLRPVFYLDLGAALEKGKLTNAKEEAREAIRRVDEQLNLTQPLYLAIDTWRGKFRFETLIEILGELASDSKLNHELTPLGPSSAELKEILRNDDTEASRDRVLTHLWNSGVRSIEGGFDLDIHKLAADKGFTLSVGQMIDRESFALKDVGEVGSGKTPFVEQLELMRDCLLSSGQLSVWFPWSINRLDGLGINLNGPLGLQMLRAVSLGRLLLPEIQYIRAPLSLLGPKLSHIALAYGANDLGFAAVDSTSAKKLGIAKLSETVSIINEHSEFAKIDSEFAKVDSEFAKIVSGDAL